MTFYTIGFAGLGLIGGSIAKAIRRAFPEIRMIAYDTDKSSLTAAMTDGTINQAHDTISVAFTQCDLIFLCAPVNVNIENLETLKSIARKTCIFTDVGSVKAPIHEAVKRLGLQDHFIGGHPMAGSEKSSYHSADPLLLENAYYILTPTETVSKDAVDAFYQLLTKINVLPIILDANKHDYIMGAISHLPHMIAFTLVHLVRDSDDSQEHMRMLAAGGFKDITRIASSSPVMWQQICNENQVNLVAALDEFIENLQQLEDYIKNNDQDKLFEFFSESKEYRDRIPWCNNRGSISSIYEIYVDLIDEAGGIAIIATILASRSINIKNIGIVHNREYQEGALRIEFYDADSATEAAGLLRRYHYVVHERR